MWTPLTGAAHYLRSVAAAVAAEGWSVGYRWRGRRIAAERGTNKVLREGLIRIAGGGVRGGRREEGGGEKSD